MLNVDGGFEFLLVVGGGSIRCVVYRWWVGSGGISRFVVVLFFF